MTLFPNNPSLHLSAIISILVIALCPGIFLASEPNPFAPLDFPWIAPSVQEVGYYKAEKIVQSIVRAIFLKEKEPVVASSCRTSLVLSEFLNKEDLKKNSKPGTLPKFSQKPQSVHEIFQVIRFTNLGGAILKKFEPRFGFDVKIVLQDKNEIRTHTHNSALASFDPIEKIIRIDKDGEIGSISYVLLHEIVHALDVDYVNSISKLNKLHRGFEKKLKALVGHTATQLNKPKDQLTQSDFPSKELQHLAKMNMVLNQIQNIQIFRAERFAYDASYDIWKELSQQFPQYFRKKPIYHENQHIIELNHLNPQYVKKFLDGQCSVYQDSMLQF